MSSSSERYTLSEELAPKLLKFGCGLSWTGSALCLMNIGTSVARWLTGYPSQGVFGVLGSLILGSGLVMVGLFTVKPSPFWRHRFFHRVICALIILSQVLDVVQFTLLLVYMDRKNDYWWTRFAKTSSRNYKLSVASIGLLFSTLSLVFSVLYSYLFHRVSHVHRHDGLELRVMIPRPENAYTPAYNVDS